jgi:hypothetical protein
MQQDIFRKFALISALAAAAALGAWVKGADTETAYAASATGHDDPVLANGAAPSAPEQAILRGRHLVLTSGCHDCHTPFKLGPNGAEPDMSRQLSGHPQGMVLPAPPEPVGPWITAVAATNTAWSGPWGISYTANLTPDDETGLGQWTSDTFVQTIRSGRHMGRGRALLPPMPVPVYQNFSDDELRAMFAYLQTIPALKNKVPEPMAPR